MKWIIATLCALLVSTAPSAYASGLYLYDASKQNLGALIYASPTMRSFKTYDAELETTLDFIQGVDGNAQLDYYQPAIYFEQSNCAGSPLVLATKTENIERPPFQHIIVKSPADAFRYVVPSDAHPVAKLLRSHTDDAEGMPCANITAPQKRTVLRLKTISLPFTEPLEWPLTIGGTP